MSLKNSLSSEMFLGNVSWKCFMEMFDGNVSWKCFMEFQMRPYFD